MITRHHNEQVTYGSRRKFEEHQQLQAVCHALRPDVVSPLSLVIICTVRWAGSPPDFTTSTVYLSRRVFPELHPYPRFLCQSVNSNIK